MTSLTTTDNKAYNFTYYDNNKHRLLSAVSVSSGVKNSFAYDDYGNLTETTVQKSDDTGRYIRQSTEYAYGGNYLYKSSNDRGYETTYHYNNTKGTLSSVTDPNDCTTSYEYDPNNDRMTTVSSDSSEVSYGYNNVGRLTSITSPSTNYTFGYDTWGNNTTVSIGNRTLVTNSYAANNGNLQSSRYGGENDGFTIGYSYDSLDRPTAKKYNGTAYFTWRYNADGNVAGYSDNILDKTYTYTYDSLGRLLQAGCSDGSYIRTSYNDLDRSTSLHYKYGGQKRDVYFGYSSKDNLPEYVKFGTGSAYQVTNAYDTLTRLYQKTYAVTGEGAEDVRADYSYINLDASRTTGVVRGIDYTYSFTSGSADLITYDRYYTYDESGNILTESVWMSGDTPNVLRENYTYDGKNQLTRHDSVTQGKSFKYYYDAAGNITSKKEYAYATGNLDETTATTVSYTYGDESWGDLLTSLTVSDADGNTTDYGIAYDTIGNPTSYLGWSFDWTGRSLTGATKGSQTLSFTYNSDGIRTSKTVNGTKTEYLLNGTQILAQKTGSDVMWFFYDSTGTRIGVQQGNVTAYYMYNLQGDVVGLADAATGKIIAKYLYDAWGKCVSVENAGGYTIGTANPFRYRGYYYDNETGFYYLNSRYYNPEVGRFINADAFASTDISGVLSTNMFAYCENNPVNRADFYGTFWKEIGDWLSNAWNSITTWVGNTFGFVSETKTVTQEVRSPVGYCSTGTITGSSSKGDENTYLYIKSTSTVKNGSYNNDYGVGLNVSIDGVDASIEYGRNSGLSYSASYNGTTLSISHNSYGDTLQVIQFTSNDTSKQGVYQEYGVSRLAECVIVAVVVFAPEALPSIAYAASQYGGVI